MLPISSFAWYGSGCRVTTLDDVCVAVCYINANLAMTKLHNNACKKQEEIKIFNDGL